MARPRVRFCQCGNPSLPVSARKGRTCAECDAVTEKKRAQAYKMKQTTGSSLVNDWIKRAW